MTIFPADLGITLNRLRQEAGLKQAEVARHLKVDASRVSRIETSDFAPSMSEVASYLNAVGSDAALSYLNFLEQDWHILSRPPFTHPNRDTLWQAEQALQRLEGFVSRPDMPRTLQGQVDLYENTVRRAASYLLELNHGIAYIGEIGVGKTSFLCTQLGLVLPETDKGSLQSRMVLEAGAGGTTICEVPVSQGENFGIKVEPLDDDEVYRLATEFCNGLWARKEGTTSDGTEDTDQEIGVSREIERALRNMAELNRTREKGAEGKPKWADPASNLAHQFDFRDAFRAEVQQRLRLWNRRRREIWFEGDSETEGLAWLKARFTEINNGRHPEFSIPKRMHVVIKQPILPDPTYQIEIVDTKGLDKVGIRSDLQRFADDSRAITVLCSKFNSAPDVSLQNYIRQLHEMGLNQTLQERTILLVLPHGEEALSMKDDAGYVVELVEEGYELKSEQVIMKLQSIGGKNIPVHFSNINNDSPDNFTKALQNRILEIRESQKRQITSISEAIDDLIANEEREHSQAVFQEVSKRINIFIRDNREITEKPVPIHLSLIRAINEANPRAIWASTRRSGRWVNFNVYYYLGVGANTDAHRRTDLIFTGVKEVIKNMLGDEDLVIAHSFLEAILDNISNWRSTFFEAVRHAGELSFRPTLEDDSNFWFECEDLYGKGLPYRIRIADKFTNWFDSVSHQALHDNFEAKIQNAWTQEVINPLLTTIQHTQEA